MLIDVNQSISYTEENIDLARPEEKASYAIMKEQKHKRYKRTLLSAHWFRSAKFAMALKIETETQ